MSFGEKILRYQDDILRDLAELIRIPSVRSAPEPGMPFGRESARALETVLSMAERLGLTVKNVDNYAGHAEYGEGEETAAASADIASDKVVTSPLVGVFYSASSPEAEPFVKVGDRIKKGQVLGIIEAMKLMNEIESEYDGVVEAILVNNEDTVEFGQPLFRIG